MKKFSYSCGCSFPMLDETTNSIQFVPDINQINLDCCKTWDLIGEGNTKGIFQLESRLGRSIAKKLKPENIEQLSALIAILRPGTLEAIRNGKSVTNHYIDKKNGLESLDYFHPALEPILKSTYGEMIYQEQAMEIAKNIAGFDLQEADMLRKAIGKKKPEEMAKVKTKFLDGAKKTKIVNIDEAEQIFGWIEKSQRYSFNKSHSISYAMNAYLSAYTKAHFPKIFFASYLRFAKDKIDPQLEIKSLVQNAREMNVDIHVPDFRLLNKLFILLDNKIYFGLTDIKGVGDSVYTKIVSLYNDLNKDIYKLSWLEILTKILSKINSVAAKALVESGAFSYTKTSRTKLLFELNIINDLTNKEIEFITNNLSHVNCLLDSLKYLISHGKVNKNRQAKILDMIRIIENPPYSLEDNPILLADSEDTLLGCSITCSRVDMYDMSYTNITCKEFKQNTITGNDTLILGGEIEDINIVKTKSGKKIGAEMCFLTLSDSSGSLESIIFFPEAYEQYKSILFQSNIIIVCGTRSKTKDSFVVEKAYIAKT